MTWDSMTHVKDLLEDMLQMDINSYQEYCLVQSKRDCRHRFSRFPIIDHANDRMLEALVCGKCGVERI